MEGVELRYGKKASRCSAETGPCRTARGSFRTAVTSWELVRRHLSGRLDMALVALPGYVRAQVLTDRINKWRNRVSQYRELLWQCSTEVPCLRVEFVYHDRRIEIVQVL